MTKEPLTIKEIQALVNDPDVSKQDMANLWFEFRDDNPWLIPFIKNKKRIIATIGTIVGLSGFTGHKAGDTVAQYILEKKPPQIQVIDPDTFEPVEDQYYEE